MPSFPEQQLFPGPVQLPYRRFKLYILLAEITGSLSHSFFQFIGVLGKGLGLLLDERYHTI